MNSRIPNQEPVPPLPFQYLKGGIAIVLLALGIVGVLWIANQLIILITSPNDISLVSQFANLDERARVISMPGGSIQLPSSFNFTVGILAYIGALGIAVSLTKLLISSGITLLDGQVRMLMDWIKSEILKMKRADP